MLNNIKNKLKNLTLPAPVANPTPHRFISSRNTVFAHRTLSVSEITNILANYNRYNRPRTSAWKEYYNEVMAGTFRYDVGQYISFDKHGNLLNGQHTLFAHWAAKKPLTTTVFVGLPSDAILFIDINIRRKSCVNPVLLEDMKAGVPSDKERFKIRDIQLSYARLMIQAMASFSGSAPNGIRQEKYFQANKKAIKLAMVGVQLYKLRRELCWTRRPGARAAIALYLLRFPEKAIQFRDELYSTGHEVISGSPVDLLRKELITPSLSGGTQSVKEMRYTMDAIQAFHLGQPFMKKLNERYQWDF